MTEIEVDGQIEKRFDDILMDEKVMDYLSLRT